MCFNQLNATICSFYSIIWVYGMEGVWISDESFVSFKIKITYLAFLFQNFCRHGNEVMYDIGKDVGLVVVSVSRVQL